MARERANADRQEASLLDRRSYLKMAGTAAAAVTVGVGNGVAATPSDSYGASGYGQTPYGGSNSAGTPPTIEGFAVSKSDQLGESRIFSVKWKVADSDEDLDVVEVVVNNGPADVNFSVQDVSGRSASGWELFQFPIGTSLDVTLRVEDSAGSAIKESKTVTL